MEAIIIIITREREKVADPGGGASRNRGKAGEPHGGNEATRNLVEMGTSLEHKATSTELWKAIE